MTRFPHCLTLAYAEVMAGGWEEGGGKKQCGGGLGKPAESCIYTRPWKWIGGEAILQARRTVQIRKRKKLPRSKRRVLDELRARCDPSNSTPGVSCAGSRLMDVTCAGLLATARTMVSVMLQAVSAVTSKSHRAPARRENAFSWMIRNPWNGWRKLGD